MAMNMPDHDTQASLSDRVQKIPEVVCVHFFVFVFAFVFGVFLSFVGTPTASCVV